MKVSQLSPSGSNKSTNDAEWIRQNNASSSAAISGGIICCLTGMHQFAKALRFMNADVEWIIERINCSARAFSLIQSRSKNRFFLDFRQSIVAAIEAQSLYLERHSYPKFASYLSCWFCALFALPEMRSADAEFSETNTSLWQRFWHRPKIMQIMQTRLFAQIEIKSTIGVEQ